MKPAPPMLVARDLRKDFPMNGETVHALRGASLTVEPGEYVARGAARQAASVLAASP